MFRGILKMLLLRKLMGGAGKTGSRSRGGCAGIGCLGLVIILVLAYFLFSYLSNGGGTAVDF